MKARVVKRYRDDCMWVFLAARDREWVVPHKAVIDVEYRAHRGCGRYHPKDSDNAMAACKQIFDGLKDARIIGSDAKDRLVWGSFVLVTTEREVSKLGGPGVTITVRPA